ncbi:hypothetical protein [Rugamonas aquatica]|uniref:Uncharacterized protein n=1 Tax=Rugamonas aquatica TaxID=2743357 RepID=A0A6A7N3A2_9BURK|nr:hypothetical protein [Rugamonas aquatica]MQA39513.1 hypothetical protein [Rugamonas aquatica]
MIRLVRFLLALLLVLLNGCGGGGSGSPTASTPTPPVVTPPVTARLTKITLQSDAGDLIGAGGSFSYSLSDAKISVTSDHNQLVVRVEGDETWTGVFQTGGTEQAQLKAGMVADVPRYADGMDWAKSGLTWFGEGRACSSSSGWFSIDSVKYVGAQVSEIKVRFERHCNGGAAALHGEVTYYADDASKPPAPVVPAPASLWRPPADVANSVGNYAYFESEDGDYVGLGKTYRYDQRNANLTVDGGVVNLNIAIQGRELWSAELRGMSGSYNLLPGYYPAVHGSRFDNPVKGGLSWTGAGRGCSKSTGWFVVDSVTSDQNFNVTAIDLRFEQHCEGRAGALRGAIHWISPALVPRQPVAGNTAVGSWRAPATALPTGGNYLYMQSDAGEALAKGLIDLQTSASAQFSVDVQNNRLSFNVHGGHTWTVSLAAQPGQAQFVKGDYAKLSGGALTVSLDSYGQFSPQGWAVIDSISYMAGKVVALDLRFEELGINGAGNDSGLLHGQLHWRADQPDAFAGPASAVPSLFWRPSSANTPPAGNYVYLESDRSDFAGNQSSYLYTSLDSLINVTATGNIFDLSLYGDERWNGHFVTMRNASQIQPGYYAGLSNSGNADPSRGNFSWGGDGRSCNTATSGVVVDKATYVGNQLVELRLRFEQHCENDPGALRGEIRWAANDAQQPSGPAAMPAGLWRAPAGTLPSSGSYLYVQSDAADAIGEGKTFLMTGNDTHFFAGWSAPYNSDAYFRLSAQSTQKGAGDWTGEFQSMIGLKKFQVGFYDHVARVPFQNRAFGGLNWSANGKGCNTSIGWFAVDKVVYVGDNLTALHARFEQHCENLRPALRGELNWEASPSPTGMRQGAGVLSEIVTREMR